MSDVVAEFLACKFITMNPLQLQCVDLLVCPACHKKSLQEKYSNEVLTASQCAICGNVYIGEPKA